RADELVNGEGGSGRTVSLATRQADGLARRRGYDGRCRWPDGVLADDDDEAAMIRRSDGVKEENAHGHRCDDRRLDQGQFENGDDQRMMEASSSATKGRGLSLLAAAGHVTLRSRRIGNLLDAAPCDGSTDEEEDKIVDTVGAAESSPSGPDPKIKPYRAPYDGSTNEEEDKIVDTVGAAESSPSFDGDCQI
ncbi:hypothetical protein ACLOJK_036429, partial [Asimina triloba]